MNFLNHLFGQWGISTIFKCTHAKNSRSWQKRKVTGLEKNRFRSESNVTVEHFESLHCRLGRRSIILQNLLVSKTRREVNSVVSCEIRSTYRSSGALHQQRLHQICHCDLQCIGPFFKLTHPVDSDSNYINHHWAWVYKGGSVVPFRWEKQEDAKPL